MKYPYRQRSVIMIGIELYMKIQIWSPRCNRNALYNRNMKTPFKRARIVGTMRTRLKFTLDLNDVVLFPELSICSRAMICARATV